MNRRSMLISLIAGPAVLGREFAAQQPGAPDPSLYIPQAHRVEDRQFLHDFMQNFPFVEIVTSMPTLRITHIPTVLDRTTGPYGTILGHISAQNPQREAFDGSHRAVVVFRGPHGYISPSWYANQNVVPTWNFAVVHASGRPRAVRDVTEARDFLRRLIRTFEASVGSTTYDFDKLPDDYVLGLMKGIAPFRMEIEAIEGKFKLGQERSEGDRRGVLAHLEREAYREQSLHQLTEAFYRMRGL